MTIVKIAALEDNPARVMMLERAMQPGHHTLERFRCGKAMIAALHRRPCDFLLLDCDTGGTSAREVLEWVRRTLGHGVPVMMTGQEDTAARVAACLAAGADAYVPASARCAELLARMEALARRAAVPGMQRGTVVPAAFGDAPAQLVCGVFRFSATERRVWVKGVPVALAPKEFALALLLFRNLGALVMRRAMIEHVWPCANMAENARTVDSHLSRVRTKLALWPHNGVMLRAVYRLGSRLDTI
ncbi:response regulator transcription factor [Cupriavidus sp. YR651]|uniref:response regulator transcription factor n=1 Tax=Cupriavidus sp. YR651 TaxID=1855315 RepID=UPI00350EF068